MAINSTELNLFVYWVTEREKVRVRRDWGDTPWTEDPILQKYHFCNVHREDDRGTYELRAVERKLGVTSDFLPTFYTVGRLFNKPTTVEQFWNGGPCAVKLAREQGATVFNTAYVVSTCGVRMDKVDYVDRVVRDVWQATNGKELLTCRATFDALRSVDGMGSFLSGQVVADLKYTPFYADTPEDFQTFAVMGPGSKKGLDFLFGSGTTENNFMDRLNQLRRYVDEMDFFPPMHNQDLQNCLCEFSKYMRYKRDLPGRRRTFHVSH